MDSINGARPRVLLVDDEPAIRHMLQRALGKAGISTEEASNGREALDLLANASFDVVVTDLNMPGQSGLEFLRAIRKKDLDMPVIVMTGNPSIDSSASALEHGAFRYLVKPVLPATLRDVVERAIGAHRLARQKRRGLELSEHEEKQRSDRAELDSRFAAALDRLWMAFQPIVSVEERRVVAYEALLRSDEPTLANPAVLLQTAERLDRLTELGRTIRTTIGHATPPDGVNLFVNLHATDLLDEELYAAHAPLTRYADRIVLEITERASIEEIPQLEERIGRLRALGFRIALDDLGAGYAGLTSFTRLEPDVAKLDMSLIRDIHLRPAKQTIVRSLQEICAELGTVVVAEGVETKLELDILVGLGCDRFQGYFFAKPGRAFPTVDFG